MMGRLKIIIAVGLLQVAGGVSAQDPCRVDPLIGKQSQSFCELQCRLSQQDASYKAPKHCASPTSSISDKLSKHLDPYTLLVGCGSGAAQAAWENFEDVFSPEQYRTFMRECSASAECRLKQARQIERFRGLKSDGSYKISDAEVTAEVQKTSFNDLLITAQHNKIATEDACRRTLNTLNRTLRSEASSVESKTDELRFKQKRVDELKKFDPGCPSALGLVDSNGQALVNGQPAFFNNPLKKTRASGAKLAADIAAWTQSLDIAYQCLDEVAQQKVFCYGLAKVLLDPAVVAGAAGRGMFGIMERRALAAAKPAHAAEVLARANRTAYLDDTARSLTEAKARAEAAAARPVSVPQSSNTPKATEASTGTTRRPGETKLRGADPAVDVDYGPIDSGRLTRSIEQKLATESKPQLVDPKDVTDLPVEPDLQRRLKLGLDQLQTYGPEGVHRAQESLQNIKRVIATGTRTPQQAVDDFVGKKLGKVDAELKRAYGQNLSVETIPLKTAEAHPVLATDYKSMTQLEQKFDVIARKASAPASAAGVHEVDTAFASRGIAERVITRTGPNQFDVGAVQKERVFAVGHKGALGFDGALSNQGGERFYAVIYPKGFVEHYSADLRASKSIVPSASKYQEQIAEAHKVLVRRSEPSNKLTGGQIHIQNSLEFQRMRIDGRPTSQIEWMRQNALGVAEFDSTGNVVRILPFNP